MSTHLPPLRDLDESWTIERCIETDVALAALAEIGRLDEVVAITPTPLTSQLRSTHPIDIGVASGSELGWRAFTLDGLAHGHSVCCLDCFRVEFSYEDAAKICTHQDEVRF